jgi:hypothetical protein
LAIFLDPSQWSWSGLMNNLFSNTARGLGLWTLVHEIRHKQMEPVDSPMEKRKP